MDAAVREQRVVGAVALVAQDGKVVYHRAVGLADREHNVPMREDALFRYASVSKPIVSATALALCDSGALDLDDPVTEYLPDFKPKLPDGSTPVIKVRELLTHTSGLGYGFTEPLDGPYHQAGVSDGLDAPGRTWPDNAKRLVSVPLRAAPGTVFHYSLSIDVLGEIIAKAGGAPLPQMVKLLIAQPLQMNDTGFKVTDPTRLAVPYVNADGGPPVMITDGQGVPIGGSLLAFSPSRAFDENSYPSGGAGMVGSARDLLTFLEAVRTGKLGIRPDTLLSMTRDQLAGADRTELGPGMGFTYGASIVLDPEKAQTVEHKGTLRWGGAYGHTWWIDPEAKLTVVLLTNTAFEGMAGQITKDVEHAVYGR